MVGGEGLHSIEAQAARIRAAREAVGADFFINARTDIFIQKREGHDEGMIDAALERANAYAEAGASGFFVPVLHDLGLLERLCAASPLAGQFHGLAGIADRGRRRQGGNRPGEPRPLPAQGGDAGAEGRGGGGI